MAAKHLWLFCLLGAMLVRAGSLEHHVRAPRAPPTSLPGAGGCGAAQNCGPERKVDRVAVLLGLRGGGARNKWRRKQNQNRAAGGGYGSSAGAGGGTAGKRVGSEGDSVGTGLKFQTRWQNFPRNAGNRRRDVSEEEEEFMSSEVMYVDSQGNEVPARCACVCVCLLVCVHHISSMQVSRVSRAIIALTQCAFVFVCLCIFFCVCM